jgi:uncharacterized protein
MKNSHTNSPTDSSTATTSTINLANYHTAHAIVGTDANAIAPFILVLNKGDKLIEAIMSCANKLQLKSAAIWGIGAIAEPKLAYYNLDTKQYSYKTFAGDFEIISLIGNITKLDDKYIVHAHIAVSDGNFQLVAGHLSEATVSVTAEITILPFSGAINRKLNSEFALNLIS